MNETPTKPPVIAQHRNSQNETITISRGELFGEPVELLVIHDDWPSNDWVPILLDDSTRSWLLDQLERPTAG